MVRVYFEDYNNQTTGNAPDGWEMSSTDFIPTISESNVFEGAKAVDLEIAVGAPTGNHFIASDEAKDPGTGDYEVKGTYNFVDSEFMRAGPSFRGSGITGQAYALALRGGNSIRLGYYEAPSEVVISTVTISYTTGTHYYIKAHADGDVIKGRFWDSANSEPGTWDIDTTDTSLGNSNHFVGAYLFNGSDNSNSVWHDVLEANDFLKNQLFKVGGL